MKNTYRSILFMTTLFNSLPSLAINVGEVTSIMLTTEASLAKEISNPTDAARLVSLRVEKISSPMEGGVVIPMENKSELLSTPANMIMPGNSKENFRVFYNGPRR